MTAPTTSQRCLIVNADDFGLSLGVNAGILRAHDQGIVTSASLMVRGNAVREAATEARRRPHLSLGLHIDLGEWAYRDGEWKPVYQVIPVDNADAVRNEIQHQVDSFIQITGQKPTHLDSHQHVHRREPVLTAALAAARQLRIPLREFTPGISFDGRFYGQTAEGEPFPDGITVKRFIEIMDSLPPGRVEISCHPGDDLELNSAYRQERRTELSTLCNPRLRAALEERHIALISYRGAADSGPC